MYSFLLGVLLALLPFTASAPSPSAPDTPAISISSVRAVFESAGYTVGPAIVWDDHARLLVASAQGGVAVVRLFVFDDRESAEAARRQAIARTRTASDAAGVQNEDAGPQLLSGFGASAWRRNIAAVQSSPALFGELMLREQDCGDIVPPPGPDLSRRDYQVDATVIALLEELP